jgi:hypothetical protein
MPSRTTAWFLSISGIITLAAMTVGAVVDAHVLSAMAAAAFGMAAIGTGFRMNWPIWRASPAAPARTVSARTAFARTVGLMAIVYVWAGLAMLLLYPVAGLAWEDGWRYGLGLSIIALCMGGFAKTLTGAGGATLSARDLDRAVQLVGLYGIMVATAVIGIIATGKLQTLQSDWAANNVFLASSFATMCLSMFAVRTHGLLTSDAP